MRTTEEQQEFIRACLRLFTHDFSSADVRFISRLEFPCAMTLIKPKCELDDPERKTYYSLEGIGDLEAVIKGYIALCTEETILEIDDEGLGKLTLVRLSEQ